MPMRIPILMRIQTPSPSPILRALALALSLTACAPLKPTQSGSRFGFTRALAIEVCLPPGQQEFLHRLRCPDGSAARQVERSSIGPRTTPRDPNDPRLLEQLDAGRRLRPGEPDFHVIDRFLVSCPDGDRTVFVDMYHCHQPPPSQAPEGMGL